jgi:hypothetical protein
MDASAISAKGVEPSGRRSSTNFPIDYSAAVRASDNAATSTMFRQPVSRDLPQQLELGRLSPWCSAVVPSFDPEPAASKAST